MKSVTVAVICSDCGKELRGTERLRGLGFHVNKHKRPDGTPCWGSRRNDHRMRAAVSAMFAREVPND